VPIRLKGEVLKATKLRNTALKSIRLATKEILNQAAVLREETTRIENLAAKVDTPDSAIRSVPLRHEVDSNEELFKLVSDQKNDLKLIDEISPVLKKLNQHCKGDKNTHLRVEPQVFAPLAPLFRAQVLPEPTLPSSSGRLLKRSITGVSNIDVSDHSNSYLEECRDMKLAKSSLNFPLFLEATPYVTDVSGRPVLGLVWFQSLWIKYPRLLSYTIAIGLIALITIVTSQFTNQLEKDKYLVFEVMGYPEEHPASTSAEPLSYVPNYCKTRRQLSSSVEYHVGINWLFASVLFFFVLHQMHIPLVLRCLSSMDFWIIVVNSLRKGLATVLLETECRYDPVRDGVPHGLPAVDRPPPTTVALLSFTGSFYSNMVVGFGCGCVDAILISARTRCLLLIMLFYFDFEIWRKTLLNEDLWELETKYWFWWAPISLADHQTMACGFLAVWYAKAIILLLSGREFVFIKGHLRSVREVSD